MFHERGYDAVGLAALTERLDIRPPSFYAAFGSKAGFFERVLERYTTTVLPLETILRPGRPPAEAMTELLESAARSYAANPGARGCLVLETSRSCADEESAALARRTADRKRGEVRDFVAATHPAVADAVRDVVANTMAGLSFSAREGWSVERLVAVAHIAANGVRTLLEEGGNRTPVLRRQLEAPGQQPPGDPVKVGAGSSASSGARR